ncbi:ATP-binding protein [Actinoplanes xinjiangensis]|uniref:ATP-binding protein n=1 Tax=Actinoplanes xinjiangensis TaxID=512350 RepID=UPI00342BEA4F
MRSFGDQQLQARLGPRLESVPAARNLVTRACHTWRLPQLQADARLVVSELTANAVQHADTDLVVTVRRSGHLLHMAVRDGDTRYPRLNGPAGNGVPVAMEERGWGLQMVHAVAAAWGAMPARGGKVVWATLAPATSGESGH